MTSGEDLFRLCKTLMIFAGLWSQKIPNAGPFYQILYKIYAISSQLIYTFLMICFGIELYILISVKNIDGALENVSRMIFAFLVFCKLMLCQSKKIIKLLEVADQEEKNIYLNSNVDTENIYLGQVKYCKMVAILLSVGTFIAGMVFIGDGLYDSYVFCRRYSKEEQSFREKPFPLRLWYPFDRNTHYFWAMLHQVATILQSIAFNGAVQALVHSVMVFIKAELQILQNNVKNLYLYEDTMVESKNRKQELIYNDLKNIARKHQELIRWFEQFNDSIKYLLLLEYGVTSLMLATTIIQIFQEIKVIFNVFFFILCLLQIFMLAWNANEILLESSIGLQDALYNSKWYELSPKSTMLIYVMMMRCRRPLSLTIGPFGPLTVDAAVSRVKLAYTFLSVMSPN